MISRILGVVALVLIVHADVASAAKRCRTDLSTLANAHTDIRFSIRTLPGRVPPPPFQVSQDFVVTKGGAVTLIENDQPLAPGVPLQRYFVSGQLTPAVRANLPLLFSVSDLDRLEDCVIENDLTSPTAALMNGTVTITLAPPDHSQIHFTIVHADPGVSDLPICGNEARLLEVAVGQTVGIARNGGLRPLQCLPG
ncbi:MAG TPA: hypothetical protein VFS60_18620 [Thermoanaerobaculia bacterium]|nr:hypothetical protein [Thermoanaerobaculia bacterium]